MKTVAKVKLLNILISTHNNRVLGLKNFLKEHKNVVFTISHQINEKLSKETFIYLKKIKKMNNVIYSSIHSEGVAKNRNNALKYRIKNSICLFADDDIKYIENAFDKIFESFKKHQDMDILTFKIKTFDGKDYKYFRKYPFKHSIRTLSNIGIIDIAFKEEVIDKYNLSFDERFGPGGYYGIGEDFIFMVEALKKGLNICFEPLDIVQHGECGTGQVLKSDIVYGRGAMFARVFGCLSFILNLYFATKNYKKYSSVFSYLRYNTLLFKGSWDFLNKRNSEK